MTGIFRTKPVTAIAVRYDGGTEGAVADVAPVISRAHGRLWVLSASGPVEVHPGWWVSRSSADGDVCVHSAEAWARYWEAVPP